MPGHFMGHQADRHSSNRQAIKKAPDLGAGYLVRIERGLALF